MIEQNKAALKTKYESAKLAGSTVNDSKARINELKALIEQRRIQRSVARAAAGGGDAGDDEADAEEERCKALIEKVRAKRLGRAPRSARARPVSRRPKT